MICWQCYPCMVCYNIPLGFHIHEKDCACNPSGVRVDKSVFLECANENFAVPDFGYEFFSHRITTYPPSLMRVPQAATRILKSLHTHLRSGTCPNMGIPDIPGDRQGTVRSRTDATDMSGMMGNMRKAFPSRTHMVLRYPLLAKSSGNTSSITYRMPSTVLVFR